MSELGDGKHVPTSGLNTGPNGPMYRDCPLCEGKGVNPVLPMYVCPKCVGEKRVPR